MSAYTNLGEPGTAIQPTQQKLPQAPAAQGQQKGFFIPADIIQQVARLYTSYRPLIGMGAKMARQKIPKELDEFMAAVSGNADPSQLQKYMTPGTQQPPPNQWTAPEEQGDEVPPNLPGQLVMTRRMTEQAYYLHEKKGMGVRAIAEKFTLEGSPVSAATVARYIREYEEWADEQEELGQHNYKRIALVIAIPALWIVSMFATVFLFKYFHVF